MFYVNVMIPVYKCKYMNYIVLLQKKNYSWKMRQAPM